jgi:hypothetical protein
MQSERGLRYLHVIYGMFGISTTNTPAAKSEIGFSKWTPHTDLSPNSAQIIGVTYMQSTNMLESVQ